jgi:hypothetical protein
VPASAVIEDCVITGSEGAGITVHEDDSLTVRRTTIRDNDVGIDVSESATTVIDSCTINHNVQHGVYVYQTSELAITHCVVDSNGTNGVFLDGNANGSVAANTVRRNTVGIYCNYSAPTINGVNDVSYNVAGIKCEDNAHATIRDNKIASNTNGVVAMDDAEPNLGGPGCSEPCSSCQSKGNNNISGSTNYHVSNLTQGVTISAQCEWWGSGGPKASKFYGSVDYSPYLGSNPHPTSPREEEETAMPLRYALHPNVPNPFNPVTLILYDVPEPGDRLTIAVYNVRGQLVATLFDGHEVAGFHSVTWDGATNQGTSAASGVYFVRMTSRTFAKTRKMVLLK